MGQISQHHSTLKSILLSGSHATVALLQYNCKYSKLQIANAAAQQNHVFVKILQGTENIFLIIIDIVNNNKTINTLSPTILSNCQ